MSASSGQFTPGQILGKRYRITKGYVTNLAEVDDAGKPVKKYCVHIKAGVEAPPDEDNLLAQVLFLRTDPQALLSKANVRPI